MKRSVGLFPGVLLVFLASGCGGVTGQHVRTSSRVLPPKPASAQIDIYRAGQRPDYVFEEVGVVSASKQARTAFGSATVSDLLPVVQDQARDLGADAIVIQDASEFLGRSLNGSPTIPSATVSGIAIAYVRPSDQPTISIGDEQPAPFTSALSTSEIVSEASPSVVQIETDTGTGSGVVVSREGLILTNDHVVSGASAILVVTSDGRRAAAALQASDPTADVALLKVELDSLATARLGSAAGLATGADIVAIGAPLGLSQTVSRGILSAKRENEGYEWIQTDAALSPGNSGGPLLNDRAEVIGIVSFKLSQPLSEGLSFALAIDDALAVMGLSR